MGSVPSVPHTMAMVPPTTTTERVIELWLHKRPRNTLKAYRRAARSLLKFLGEKTFHDLTLEDLQGWIDSLEGKPRTIAARISAIKSLFTFCHKTGYLPINKGITLDTPRFETRIDERILSVEQVMRILALEEDARNHALLRFLYNTGARASEVSNLTWGDIFPHQKGGRVRLWGKREKERYVLISAATYQELIALRQNADDTRPVFCSRTYKQGERLSRTQIYRIVWNAGKRAGILKNVYPHMLRHSHGSHSLERKAPLHLVRDTMGHSDVRTLNPYLHSQPEHSSGEFLPV